MIIGFLIPLVLIVVVVLVIRKAMGRQGGAAQGTTVRRFFQYLLMLGLVNVVGIGVSGLLARAFGATRQVAGGDAALAQALAFTVVGIPLLALMAAWTRRRLAQDPIERSSFAWAAYVTVVSIVSLIASMVALHEVLDAVFGTQDWQPEPPANLLTWGSVFAVHWVLDVRVTPVERRRVHHTLGSVVGLATTLFGLVAMLGALIERILGLGGDQFVSSIGDPLLRGASTFIVGALAWVGYWLLTASKSARDALWFAYVLLAGVGAGFVLAVASASKAVYDVLVWFIGDPRAELAEQHFRGTTMLAVAGVIVGLLSWWYHRQVLAAEAQQERTEIDRIHDHLLAAIGLVAAAIGVAMVLVSIIEAATASSVLAGSRSINTLLAALTLLAVGGPVWWWFWRRIEHLAATRPETERVAPTRRIYLFVLFGVGGISAVVSLLTGVYVLFQDLVAGDVDGDTLHRMRFSLAVLLTTGAVAAYHWLVYRGDREVVGHVAPTGPRTILLVGPNDPEVARALARATGARVTVLARIDGAPTSWDPDVLRQAVSDIDAEQVLVLAEPTGPRVIPVQRV